MPHFTYGLRAPRPPGRSKRVLPPVPLIEWPHRRAAARATALLSPKAAKRARCRMALVRAVPTAGGGALIHCIECGYRAVLERWPG